ncbi:MAG: NADP(H)-dependent aldo-keto reductase [Alphaproteobacteria bacterium]|nr:MAG: NADP(H)-dependent aldo-keto reductase [Alphaproteobacteria bacterium]
MQYRPLGRTGLSVSAICLGTMTWGEQNTEAEGHAQMDFALDQGVTFWDAAEMYPVPPRAETYGETERIIGTWFAKTGKREQVILATKVLGSGALAYVRDGTQRLDRKSILAACDASLARLQTDYIDLYQLHWPDRPVNSFGKLGYTHVDDPATVPLEESLSALHELVTAGKVRAIGLSNETPWGVMTALALAATKGLPRVASIQNPYSLLNRAFEVGLAEVAIREEVGLLAYSPLAMGVLAGKYVGGARPPGARITLYERFKRYSGPRAMLAGERYVAIAKRHGLAPDQMALAFVTSRAFTTSTIIGATSLEQLQRNIASIDVTLTPEVLEEIEAVHLDHSNPAP